MKNINNSENRINVDSSNYSFLANYKQEDDAVLTIDLFRNGIEFDVTGQEVSLAAIREDKIIIEQLEGFSINKNKVTIEFKNNILEVPGTVLCELNFIDSQGSMTTTDFKIKVNKKILTVDAISANDLETINKIKQEELKRQNNETSRINSEDERRTEEENRKREESIRINAENTRVNNENKRKAAEENRSSTFNNNEENRQNVFNSNEEIRQSEENTRKSNETNRINAENTRVNNEIERNNSFNSIKEESTTLINEMNTAIDGTIIREVVDARGDKESVGARITDMETQSVENTNSIENILQEFINCIKKDGSIPFETGQDKGVKIGENIDIVEVNNNIYIRNKSNPDDFKILQLTHDGFLLPAGNLQIGSGNYRFRKIWVGAESNLVERGFVTLTNDWVLIFGTVDNAPGQEAARFEFPMRVERFFHPSLTGQWMHDHNHYWTLGMTDYKTYIEVIKHNNIGVSDQCNIMLLCKI